jgi:hypothetical protein
LEKHRNADHQEDEAEGFDKSSAEDARRCGEADEKDDEGKAWTGAAAQDVKKPAAGSSRAEVVNHGIS